MCDGFVLIVQQTQNNLTFLLFLGEEKKEEETGCVVVHCFAFDFNVFKEKEEQVWFLEIVSPRSLFCVRDREREGAFQRQSEREREREGGSKETCFVSWLDDFDLMRYSMQIRQRKRYTHTGYKSEKVVGVYL